MLAQHLRRYEAWLRSLDGAPAWGRVAFVDPAALRGRPAPAVLRREQLLSPEQAAAVFEPYTDGRYSWINLECLGMLDDTLCLTWFVSSGGPAAPPRTPRDRIAVNFSGPDARSRWDATARIRIVSP